MDFIIILLIIAAVVAAVVASSRRRRAVTPVAPGTPDGPEPRKGRLDKR